MRRGPLASRETDSRGKRGARSGERRLPLEHWLRRRRRLRLAYAVTLITLLLAGTLIADREAGALARLERVQLHVAAVRDAATLELTRPSDDPKPTVTVRLAGVDIDGPWAQACQQTLARQVIGRHVRISWRQRVPEPGGEAYVYLGDGTLLNAWLIENGHARAATRQGIGSTHALADWFERLEARASQSDRGLWVDLAENAND